MNLVELDAAINLLDRTTAKAVDGITAMLRPHMKKTEFTNPKTGARAMLWVPSQPIVILVDRSSVVLAGIGDGWFTGALCAGSRLVYYELSTLSLKTLRALYRILMKQLPRVSD